MVKALEQAIERLSRLPDVDQERIGRTLLSHIEKLITLRMEVDKGLRSLDAGEGHPLDLDAFLRQKKIGRD
jgi:hypothetical protein